MDVSKMSYQAIFNKVAKHLIKQNSKAIVHATYGDYCVCYDKATQKRCAAGCLLPLEFYKNGNVVLTKVIYLIQAKGERLHLIKKLQYIHDDHSPKEWRKELIKLSKEYSLKIPDFLK